MRAVATASLVVAVTVAASLPSGLNDALLELVAKPNTTCLAKTNCDDCARAECIPCNLNSAGDYSWPLMETTDKAKLDKYKIPANNFACISVQSKCDTVESIFDAAQTASTLVPAKDYKKTNTTCDKVETLKHRLLSLVTDNYNATCDGHTECESCISAGCNPCQLNKIGDYVFDEQKSFFTTQELQEFTSSQIESKLICGVNSGNCLAVRDIVDELATQLGFPSNYKKVVFGTCGAVGAILKSGLGLALITVLLH